MTWLRGLHLSSIHCLTQAPSWHLSLVSDHVNHRRQSDTKPVKDLVFGFDLAEKLLQGAVYTHAEFATRACMDAAGVVFA